MEIDQLLLSVGLSLSKERKNQTKVDLLIHQGRTWNFSLFWLAKQSFKYNLELHHIGSKQSGKYNFS